jgi:hypothetical protein
MALFGITYSSLAMNWLLCIPSSSKGGRCLNVGWPDAAQRHGTPVQPFCRPVLARRFGYRLDWLLRGTRSRTILNKRAAIYLKKGHKMSREFRVKEEVTVSALKVWEKWSTFAWGDGGLSQLKWMGASRMGRGGGMHDLKNTSKTPWTIILSFDKAFQTSTYSSVFGN